MCLGKQFSGGELFFRGTRCDKHVNTGSHAEVSLSLRWKFIEVDGSKADLAIKYVDNIFQNKTYGCCH